MNKTLAATIMGALILLADLFGLRLWSFVTEQWVIGVLAVLTPIFVGLFPGSGDTVQRSVGR